MTYELVGFDPAEWMAGRAGAERSSRCDDVTFNPSELDDVLTRLEDAGQVVRVQRNAGYPLHLVAKEDRVFDAVDELAADICAVIKKHGEQFADDDQLRSHLDADRVRYNPQSFAVALRQLEGLGRIRRLRADDFGPDWKVPGCTSNLGSSPARRFPGLLGHARFGNRPRERRSEALERMVMRL